MDYIRIENTIIARLDRGEEVITKLVELSKKEGMKLANVNGIGATDKFKVGLFDVDLKEYHSTEYTGSYEITSLMGTISTMNGEPYTHIHMNATDEKNITYGGHLNEAYISATCELVIQVINGEVDREFSREIGINLFKF